MGGSKIKNFTELNAWREGHKLVLMIYKITKDFPAKEQFVLTSQVVRAVISVTSNIAEGFGRRGLREKIQFYYLAQSSLTEVQNQLIISKDVEYLSRQKFEKVWDQTVVTHKLISGLIRSLNNK
ncbi:hypothetical protein A2125_02445 [Candidatus Woesebacteria bacterium GWB1_43_5]|uniref:Four helix bundle protein n=1 Tax=Candidatus Woesebacteria bacterium GWB1_43_5 TaxID=1802474 RepID=A0A1F7WU61_9BACT|nr:MAG: hypothetical protein A2125_02445 [Candidatus Woesebacteria bacterium GWB1_43_5]